MSTQCQEAKLWDELDPGVRRRALERNRELLADGRWWRDVYEDADTAAKCLGVEMDRIWFSGFSSQGDGACFIGSYKPNPQCVDKVKYAYPQDSTLISIAEGLAVLNVTQTLEGLPVAAIRVSSKGNYCHSGTMEFEFSYSDDPLDDSPDLEPAESQYRELLRRFADWIYAQLEAEHEHLTSDEALIDAFKCNKYRFAEDGSII